jgi:hypothetical protein
MNIVSSFDTLESLNEYQNSQLSHSSIIKIDDPILFYCWKNISQYIENIRLYQTEAITHSHLTTLVNNDIINNCDYPFDEPVSESTKTFIEAQHAELSQQLADTGSIYIYPYSKTMFRKVVHSNIPESLYKKYYKLSKLKSIITQANGSYVEIRSAYFVEEDLKSLNPVQLDSSNIIAYIEGLEDDKLYYSSMVSSLSAKVQELETTVANISEQLSNKYLTSWA